MRPLSFHHMFTAYRSLQLFIRRIMLGSVRASFALILLCCFVAVAPGAEAKPYPLSTCIVSGDKIDPNVAPIVHNNQQVKFCCKGCIKKFNACPDKYMVRLQGADAGKKK